MQKVIRIGRGQHGDVFCKITFNTIRLSIVGVEGPKRNGDTKGSCGQIVDDIVITDFAPGWDAETLAKFKAIWRRWHLNDLRAGSPAQEAYLREHPAKNGYLMVKEELRAVGLEPDAGYSYGSNWLSEPVPVEVTDWLFALPDADKTPAWV